MESDIQSGIPKKEGGWSNYFENTKNNKKMDALSNKKIEDTDSAMKSLYKEIDRVRYKVFGKVSINKNKKVLSKADKVFGQEKCQELAMEQNRLIENDQRMLKRGEQLLFSSSRTK